LSQSELKIVVVGRKGQVASDLQSVLPSIGSVVSVGRPEFDLTDPVCIRRTVRELQPDVLINAAAYTAVDQAESEPDLAMRVNAEAPGIMAEEAKRLGALFIHYSSDYVFDGVKDGPYSETDKPNPRNAYGVSKLAGDRAVAAADGAFMIFRTSWVYSTTGKNFLATITKLAGERDELRIVNDQIGSPTWSRDIANATMSALVRINRGVHGAELSGIYNLTSGGQVSWYGFAEAIIAELTRVNMLSEKVTAALVPIPTASYPTPARRPSNSCLSNKKIGDVLGIHLPEWRDSLVRVVGEMARARVGSFASGERHARH
jgi:dTDP-4-dehydrorhamnose reductase